MASSTAPTTMSGLMPFSRLRASITLYSSLAIKFLPPYWETRIRCPAAKLELGNEIGSLHIRQLDLDCGACRDFLMLLTLLAAREFQTQPSVLKCFQASFKMPIAVDRIARHQLHQAASETRKVCGFRKLAVQPRRRNFQRVGRARNRVFHIENGSGLTAEIRAI